MAETTTTITLGNPVITATEGKVTATYVIGGKTYTRKVNCVFNPEGRKTQTAYDKDATMARAQEILNGILNKINAGVIVLES